MTDRRTADNKGFAIAGVSCFADTFVQVGSSVLRMKFSAKTPRPNTKPENVTCKCNGAIATRQTHTKLGEQ